MLSHDLLCSACGRDRFCFLHELPLILAGSELFQLIFTLPLLAHLLDELTLQFPSKLLILDPLMNLLLALDLRQRPVGVYFRFYSNEIDVMFAAQVFLHDFLVELVRAITTVRASLLKHVRGPVPPELPHLFCVVVAVLPENLSFVYVFV